VPVQDTQGADQDQLRSSLSAFVKELGESLEQVVQRARGYGGRLTSSLGACSPPPPLLSRMHTGQQALSHRSMISHNASSTAGQWLCMPQSVTRRLHAMTIRSQMRS